MKKTNWREAIKKDKRTKNLLKYEEQQAKGYFKEGIVVGLVLGGILTAITYLLIVWING